MVLNSLKQHVIVCVWFIASNWVNHVQSTTTVQVQVLDKKKGIAHSLYNLKNLTLFDTSILWLDMILDQTDFNFSKKNTSRQPSKLNRKPRAPEISRMHPNHPLRHAENLVSKPSSATLTISAMTQSRRSIHRVYTQVHFDMCQNNFLLVFS